MWGVMKSSVRRAGVRVFLLGCLLTAAGPMWGDVGLIVETPTGMLGFFSDVGHASVWISRGCLGAQGQLEYCENSKGIVLTSTSYWPNPGAAAIPAELFFLGSTVGGGAEAAAWTQDLAGRYPEVGLKHGSKYLGR